MLIFIKILIFLLYFIIMQSECFITTIMEKVKLNLGCGNQFIDGWINVDYSLGSKLSKAPFFSLINKQVKLLNIDWDERIFIHDLTQTKIFLVG